MSPSRSCTAIPAPGMKFSTRSSTPACHGRRSPVTSSAAVGAFMLGIAISGATAHNATRILEPLRDLFAAIFFVAFGLNTDPSSIPPVLGWALLLALATVVTKVLTGFWAAKRAGIAVPGRFRAGAALIARGEFSIVIAGLAVASGVVPRELAALATAYVLLMAIIGPLAARFVEPTVKAFRKSPRKAKASEPIASFEA